ncbi:hypothetical protein WJX73_004699, partial [Symbiochloris irregularis]
MLQGLPKQSQAKAAPSTVKEAEEDVYLLAKSYFDVKAFRRCAHALRNTPGPKALFLRSYSLYISGERHREQQQAESAGNAAGTNAPTSSNQELRQLERDLTAAAASGKGDAFCSFLLGLILADLARPEEAAAALASSVAAYPCNRDAWVALAKLQQGSSDTQLSSAALPSHWMRDVYLASVALDAQENTEALSRLQALAETFPESEWLIAQAALAQYNLRNFDTAQELFEDLLKRDPNRIESMDTYSNILYVKEEFVPLSHLAHRAMASNKFTPETCCIVGNYYSLKGLHDQ